MSDAADDAESEAMNLPAGQFARLVGYDPRDHPAPEPRKPRPAILLRDTPEDIERLAAALEALWMDSSIWSGGGPQKAARAIIERLRR